MIKEAAIKYHGLGYNVIPVTAGKVPTIKWEKWQSHRQSDTDLAFTDRSEALAVVGGINGVVAIDIDLKNDPTNSINTRYWTALIEASFPIEKIYVQRSPSGGGHIIFRSSQPFRNEILAKAKDGKTIIETRGLGGYFLIAPSPGYLARKGSLDDLPVLTEDEESILIDTARQFNDGVKPKMKSYGIQDTGRVSAWQDFNNKNDYTYLQERLSELGWTEHSINEDRILLTRPGKTRGNSGDINMKLNLFKTWSSNGAPFEPEVAYTPFDVYALLDHNGDGPKAASVLYNEGYGDRYEEDPYEGLYVFDPNTKPPNTQPCMSYKSYTDKIYPFVGMGKVMALGGLSGARKTTFLQAMYAGSLKNSPFLGVEIDLNNKDLLVIDTEQDDSEIFNQNMTMMKMVNATQKPSRFLSVGMANLEREKGDSRRMWQIRRQRIEQLLAAYKREIGWLVLDNARDLVSNYNDLDAGLEFIDWLKEVRAKTKALITIVLHTAKTSGGMKGNLGTLLFETCSTYLEVIKHDDHSEVKFIKTRGYQPPPNILFTHKDGMPAAYRDQYGV